jgi:hypothetical protein
VQDIETTGFYIEIADPVAASAAAGTAPCLRWRGLPTRQSEAF